MKTKNVFIIGGGFAGLAAARILAKNDIFAVTVISKRTHTQFLPLLPDVISQTISPSVVSQDLPALCRKIGVSFLANTVDKINQSNKSITLANGIQLFFDYVIIACGAEANFFGNPEFKNQTLTLDSVESALQIQAAVLDAKTKTIVFGGAGYTGIETATHLRKLLKKNQQDKKIILVDPTDTLLKPMPPWMQVYVAEQLAKQNIEYYLNEQITSIKADKVVLKSGKALEQALVIWSAGIKAPEFVQKIPADKDGLGRLKVDQYLRLTNNIFVVGDSAFYLQNDKPLRPSVRFAVDEGRCAAKNILHLAYGQAPQAFKSWDPGYLIPLANRKSCGLVLGFSVKGFLATSLHYILCIWLGFGLFKRLRLSGQALRHLLGF